MVKQMEKETTTTNKMTPCNPTISIEWSSDLHSSSLPVLHDLLHHPKACCSQVCSVSLSSSLHHYPLLFTDSLATHMSEESHGNYLLRFILIFKTERKKKKQA